MPLSRHLEIHESVMLALSLSLFSNLCLLRATVYIVVVVVVVGVVVVVVLIPHTARLILSLLANFIIIVICVIGSLNYHCILEMINC